MIETEALSALDDAHQVMRAFAVHAPIGIQIYNADGYCIFVNDKFKEIFGNAPPPGYCVLKDELVAAAGWLHLIHKAFGGEKAALPLLWYDARDLTELGHEDLEYTKQFGKKCAIETCMVPVKNDRGVVTNVLFLYKDVTAEMFMKRERDDAKALVQNVLDQTKAVIYIKDLEGRYVFANKQYERIFNLNQESILGKTDFDIFPNQTAKVLRKNDLEVLQNKVHREIEETVVHADGSSRTYLSLKFPLNDSTGSCYGVCGISTDITRHLAREKETRDAKARLEKLTQREREILRLVLSGLQSKAIADKVALSVSTVDNHRANIMKKLQANTSADLARIALLADASFADSDWEEST